MSLNIDIKKTVSEYLPTFMRGTVVDYIMILLTNVQALQTSFNSWREISVDRLYISSQVAALEVYLSAKTNSVVSVVEGDGKPIDFSVYLQSDVSSSYVSALIDKLKLAGRNYAIQTNSQAVTVAYTDYVCEQSQPTVVVAHNTYVCEQEDRIEVLTVTHSAYVCEQENE